MNTLLQQGEYPLGRYTVRYAYFTTLGWDARGPWMRALITNRRFILIPEEAQSHIEPCVIEGNSVTRAWNVSLGKRDGVIIGLKNGQLIYLFIDWGQGARLVKDVREMLTPAAQPRIVPRLPSKNYMN